MTKQLLIIALFGLLLALTCVLGQATAQATGDNQVAKDGKGIKEPETKVKAVPKSPAEENPAKTPAKEISLPKGVGKDNTKTPKTSDNVGKGKANGKGKEIKSPKDQTETPTLNPINSKAPTEPVPTNPAAANSTEPVVPNAKNPKAKAKAPEKTAQSPTPVGKQIAPTQPPASPAPPAPAPPTPSTPPAPPAEFPSPNTAQFPDNAQPPPPNVPAPETPEDSASESKTVKIVKEQNPKTTTVVTVVKNPEQAIEQNDTSAARRSENYIQLEISLLLIAIVANFIA